MKKIKKSAMVKSLKKVVLSVMTGVLCMSSIMPAYAEETMPDEVISVETEMSAEENAPESEGTFEGVIETDVIEINEDETESLNAEAETETGSIAETETIDEDISDLSEEETSVDDDQIELFSMGYEGDANGNMFGVATEIGDDGALKIVGTGSMEDVFGPSKQQIGRWMWQNLPKWRYYKITLSEGLTSIGAYAFEGFEGLAKIIIPNTVTRISDGAFKNCRSLRRIEIPESVVEFGDNIFAGTPIEEIYVIEGSAAHRYCQENALPFFVLVKDTEPEGHQCSTWDSALMKATLTKDGYSGEKCSECDLLGFHTMVYRPSVFELSKTTYVYDGKVKSPKLTIKDRQGNVISNDNYDVTKSAGRKNPGTYSYKIKFKGKYSGTKTVYYDILPATPARPAVSTKNKAVKVSLAKQSAPITGFQVQYATSKDFKSNNKMITISSSKATSKTISNLVKSKKYYVRIRTYKLTADRYLCSSWSPAKAITVK